MLNATIDLAELHAHPSAWFNTLASAIARGDEAAIRDCQARLQALGWLVLSAKDVERLHAEHEAEEPREQQPEPEAPEPPAEPEESPS